ncbi:hypothetical protein FQZ97_1169920 [compost metagenome]
MCRKRPSVITCMTSSRSSSGEQVRTSAVMIAETTLLITVPSLCRCRTTSRSETMPSSVAPSALTTTAPMLCSARVASSSRTPASGRMVTTSRSDFDCRMSEMRM